MTDKEKKKYQGLVKSTALLLALFLLFKKLVDGFITNSILRNIPPNSFSASWVLDIAIATIFLTIILPALSKIFKGVALPAKWHFLGLYFTFVYLFYRIPQNPFVFTDFSLFKGVKLLDLLFSIPATVIIFSLFFRPKIGGGNEQLQSGFSVDEAREIDENSDMLNRSKFVTEIANKIKNTSLKNGSFPIGVVAAWGSGKSTFLNTLLTKLKKENFITIDLNVWKCTNSNQIIENLFKQLNKELKKYSFSLSNRLQDYTSNLLKGTKNEGLNSIKNLSEVFFSNDSIEKQYDSINDEIKKINRKIIILIDDLDRLDKKEIYEVIRLIRNTANFANTFFVVAYDRNYILNAIEEINPYQSHYFLEKIFQIEFSLPPISQKILQREITKRITPFLTEKGKQGYEDLITKGFNYYEWGDADLTALFISNMRDVIRFINSFKLSYQFVKDEVYFPDFYNLELVRFKHPDFFLNFYNRHSDFLTIEKAKNQYPTISGNAFSLKMIKDEKGSNTNESELRKYIENKKSIYKLNTTEINTICSGYSVIFPQPNNILSSRTKGINSHLTVLRPSMIDRYFLLGVEGRLSEIEFSKVRELTSEHLNNRIAELCKNEDIIDELADRLEAISNFDSKEDFEKIINAIFHFANLPNKNGRLGFVGYDGKSLSKILGKENNLNFYENNVDEYRVFLLKILKTNGASYTYTNDFANDLLKSSYYNVEKVLPKEIISDILLHNFEKALLKCYKCEPYLFWHFYGCECRQETPTGASSYTIEYAVRKEAKLLMRKFILAKDIDGFILMAIRQTPFNKRFILETTISSVFKENRYFVRLIKLYKLEFTFRDEFIEFYKLLATDPICKKEGVPLNFFKVIPVKYSEQ